MVLRRNYVTKVWILPVYIRVGVDTYTSVCQFSELLHFTPTLWGRRGVAPPPLKVSAGGGECTKPQISQGSTCKNDDTYHKNDGRVHSEPLRGGVIFKFASSRPGQPGHLRLVSPPNLSAGSVCALLFNATMLSKYLNCLFLPPLVFHFDHEHASVTFPRM